MKQRESCFDVTMGSFDGVEVCELASIYILWFLANIINKKDCGLYWDDGLLILRNVNGQEIDRMRKNIIKMFKDICFCHRPYNCRPFTLYVQLKQWHI